MIVLATRVQAANDEICHKDRRIAEFQGQLEAKEQILAVLTQQGSAGPIGNCDTARKGNQIDQLPPSLEQDRGQFRDQGVGKVLMGQE